MTPASLAETYRAYIDCLNGQDWPRLGSFVGDDVEHNGRPLGLAGYQGMLEQDYADIPDLQFVIEWLVSEPPRIAARLAFRCSPKALFLGLQVNGRRVSFAENVFYEFRAGKIAVVWSILDKAAVEAQITTVKANPGRADGSSTASIKPS